MFPVFNFSESHIYLFVLIFIRLSIFFVTWPVFSANQVPITVKILFGVLVTMLIFPIFSFSDLGFKELERSLIWLAMREAFIGMILGFSSRLFFFAISVGGQVISLSMGLGNAQLFNPTIESSSTVMEQFQTILATLFFLVINGHHLFLHAIVHSYQVLPIKVVELHGIHWAQWAGLAHEILLMGLKMGAPVLVALLLMNLAMGIIGRVIPQINVLITSASLNILAGFFVITLSIPLIIEEMGWLAQSMIENLFNIMKHL